MSDMKEFGRKKRLEEYKKVLGIVSKIGEEGFQVNPTKELNFYYL